jgi:hypothetical protein
LNFLYLQNQSVQRRIFHKCLTILLSSRGLQFQAETVTDPKTHTIYFRREHKEK